MSMRLPQPPESKRKPKKRPKKKLANILTEQGKVRELWRDGQITKTDRVPVNLKRLGKLAAELYTDRQLAKRFGITHEEFKRRWEEDVVFRNTIDEGRAEGCAHIQSAQMKKGIKKLDTPMLIHLGKHHLGQKENQIPLGNTNVQINIFVDDKIRE